MPGKPPSEAMREFQRLQKELEASREHMNKLKQGAYKRNLYDELTGGFQKSRSPNAARKIKTPKPPKERGA